DIATDLANLTGVGKLLGGTLHTQVELCPQQALELFAELGGIFRTEFACFHGISLSANVTRHECRRNWQLSGGQAESFTCKLFAYTFHFVEHLAGLNFCDPVL